MSACIETPNKRNAKGYGKTTAWRFGTRIHLTHRLAWVDANGRLPLPGMFTLHTCDNPPCINPEHLYEGTHQQNMLDMISRGRVVSAKAQQTHCDHGHAFTDENTIVKIRPSGKYAGRVRRRCRTCENEGKLRSYYALKKVS